MYVGKTSHAEGIGGDRTDRGRRYPRAMSGPTEIGVPEPFLARLLLGARQRENWVQLLRFGVVGASGYAVNLVVFAIFVGPIGSGYRIAAVVAFIAALTNNFIFNRLWTFSESTGRVHRQATRFVVVSLVGFAIQFGVLELLVALTGLPEIAAQALSVAVATPCNFLGNRLWTFRIS